MGLSTNSLRMPPGKDTPVRRILYALGLLTTDPQRSGKRGYERTDGKPGINFGFGSQRKINERFFVVEAKVAELETRLASVAKNGDGQ